MNKYEEAIDILADREVSELYITAINDVKELYEEYKNYQEAYELLLKEKNKIDKALEKACKELAKFDLFDCKWTVSKWKGYLLNGKTKCED